MRLVLGGLVMLCSVVQLCIAGPVVLAQDAATGGNAFVLAVEDGSAFNREDLLEAITTDTPYQVPLLLAGIESPNALVRQVAALQLGEIEVSRVDATLIEALYKAIGDADSYVSAQAIASTIRLATLSPEMALNMLDDGRPLADFSYASERANQGRTIAIAPADLGAAGLFYGAPAPLDRVVELYREARKRELIRKPAEETDASADRFDFDYEEYEPGESDYYLQILSVLLPKTLELNGELARGLLLDADDRLRLLAFGAMLQTTDSSAFIGDLEGIVLTGAEADRKLAAAGLASSEEGRNVLLELSRAAEADRRALAFGSLLKNADCQDPHLIRALADGDLKVKTAAVEAIVEEVYRRAGPLTCLASMALDKELSDELRQGVLYAVQPPSYDFEGEIDVDTIFGLLHPLLSDADDPLYSGAWEAFASIVRKGDAVPGPGISRQISQLAVERLKQGAGKRDETMLCLLDEILPEALEEFPELMLMLADSLNADWAIVGCARSLLARVYRNKPISDELAEMLVANMLSMSFIDGDLLTITGPTPAFRLHWQELAGKMTGRERLAVYRAARLNGLIPDGVSSTDVDVLLGQVAHLGVTGQDDYDLEYYLMPDAVMSLFMAGPEGHDILANFLRGSIGGPLARQVIASTLGDMKAARPEDSPARVLADPLVDALDDPNWHVRWATVYALPTVLTEAELVRALKTVFTDPSEQVQYAVERVLTDEIVARAGSALASEDLAALVSAMMNHGEDYARQSAAELLARFGKYFSADFVKSSLLRLLEDESQGTVGAALEAVPDLGPTGVAALKEALSSSTAEHLFQWSLVATLRTLSDHDRNEFLPLIQELQEKYQEDAYALQALNAVGGGTPVNEAVLVEELESSEEAVRDAAILALSNSNFLSPSDRYLAAIVAENTADYLKDYLGDVLERVRPYFGSVPSSETMESFPDFPWPPPQWSFKEMIPIAVLNDGTNTLGGASSRIATALRQASRDYDFGLFEIPGGFVALARLERINADGTPVFGPNRWDDRPKPPNSLVDYLVELFLSPPGYFRIIAFAVTTEEPAETDPEAALPEFNLGTKTLPEEIANRSLAGHEAFALVYTFERRNGGKLRPDYQGSPSGLTHLINAGIWSALDVPRAAWDEF